MSRYIDADALIADIEERYCKPCKEKGEDYNEVRCRACWVDDAIDEVDGFGDNAIDAVSVVHGEWIFKPTFPNDTSEFPMGHLECSICGSWHSNSKPCNFCDNCGAKMDGGKDQ